ncbi:MAG: histidine kinase dimerization/phosphoacceptor domain -containing protein [Hyphomicrobiaceae bacterium]
MSALRDRIRQQEVLAELGVIALQGASLDQLLQETARLTAEGLKVEFCKVLEHIPSSNRLLVRAGVGWDANVVGIASVGSDLESPAGFALRTGKPVISNHLENEDRFRTSELMEQHGIRRAMNVILQGDGKPFGVLEVDSRSDTDFLEHDLAFLQGAANICGMAIERERQERRLTAALEKHQLLLKEMNHRVKNSLTIVVSMLNLQAREIASPELRGHLNEAANRIAAIGKAHDQLSYESDIERMDIGQYIKAICKDLDGSVAHCDVITDTVDGIVIQTDRAISIALIVNELITNAAKYAYKNEDRGKIWIKVSRDGHDTFSLSVRDEGTGLPPDFDLHKAKGLGMRIVAAFAKQVDAAIAVCSQPSGTEFVLTIPIEVVP